MTNVKGSHHTCTVTCRCLGLRLWYGVPPMHVKLLRTPIHYNMFHAHDRACEIKFTTNWVRDGPSSRLNHTSNLGASWL